MSTLANLVIQMSANTTALEKGFKRAQTKTSALGNTFKKVGTIAAGFLSAQVISGGVQKLTGFLSDCTAKAKEQALVEAQLAAVLKSTGGAAGITADEVKQLASDFQKLTNYGDEATLAAQNMLLTFTNIGKDVFPATTKVVLDMATAMGQDLQQTAVQVGKALQDPVQGVTALQRVGVRLTEQQKEQVESMVAVGDAAGAQKLILAELTKEFGGSAEAAVAADSGMQQMSNRMGDLQEKIGTKLLPVMAKWKEIQLAILDSLVTKVGPVLQKIGDEWIPKVKQAFNDWVDAMGPTIEDLEELRKAAEGLAEALGKLDISFIKSEGEITDFMARNTVLRMQVGMLTESMEMWTALLEGRWADAFKNFIQIALVPFQIAWETTRGTVATVMVAMGKAVEWGINAIIDLLNDLTGALNWVSKGIKKFSFGKIDPGTIGSIEKVTLRVGDLESMLRGSTDAMQDFGHEAGTVDMILQRMGVGLAGGDGGGPGVDGGGGDGGGGGGGGAGALAQAVDILTPGMAALNAEVEREEVLLVNIAKALTTATTQHDMITEAITTTEKALNDAERAMSDWENAVLKGTRAFSDMAFGISQDMDRLQLKMNEISLGVLEEGLEEGGYASDALERKIRKLADTFGVELFGGALDWGDIQKVLDAAGIAMEKLSLESRNVNLRENLSLGPKQRELDQFFEDQAGYAESTLPEIKEGWLKAKDQADKLVGSLDDWNAALIINEIHMTFLQGLLDNHRAYLTDIRDLYIDIERAAQDAWSAAAELPAGTSITPSLPVPVYHQGGYVPRTGLAMLRAGEQVIAPGGAGAAPIIVNIGDHGIYLMDRRQREEIARQLVPEIQRRMR